MAALPQVVRDEHSELVARIELLQTVADSIGSAAPEALREGVGQAYTFLIHQLIPHAQAEEQVLYPTVGRLLRTLEATDTMSRDHLVRVLADPGCGVQLIAYHEPTVP